MDSGVDGDNHLHRSHISHNVTLAAVSSLFAVTLIVITIFIFCKYRQNRSQNHRRVDFVSRLVTTHSSATRGLDPAVLNSLPVFAAAAAIGGAPPAECSVCLGNVAGERAMVRLLPNCGHSFHVDCVDTWLASHTTCPLCRSEVEPEPEPPGAQATASPVDEISLLNAGDEVAAAVEGKATRLSSFKRMLSGRERSSSSTRSLEMVIEP